jgi:hypothetical protein
MSDAPDSTPPTRHIDLSDYLARREPRADNTPVSTSEPSGSVRLATAEELQIAAVALLMLERLAAHNGSRIPVRPVRELRQRATRPFQSADVMALEVEAYDTLCWVAGISPGRRPPGPPQPRKAGQDAVLYDPKMPVIDLLRRAIAEEFDVDMQYYTQSRGELTKRRVSPLHIEAETYLHAYCHARRAERVFRMSRIAELRPVDGRAVGPPRPGKDSADIEQGKLDF